MINDLGEWVLSESDIECIGIGAGILGCGGGGDPHLGKLIGKMAVREGKTIRIITPENLKRTIESKAAKQCIGIPIAMMGAPLIMKEELVSGETVKAIKYLQNLYDNGYCNGQLPSSFNKNLNFS